MGNKASQKLIADESEVEATDKSWSKILITYRELISRDFEDAISLIAAKKYPNNLQKAVDYILENNQKQSNPPHINQQNIENKDDAESEQTQPISPKLQHAPALSPNSLQCEHKIMDVEFSGNVILTCEVICCC